MHGAFLPFYSSTLLILLSKSSLSSCNVEARKVVLAKDGSEVQMQSLSCAGIAVELKGSLQDRCKKS